MTYIDYKKWVMSDKFAEIYKKLPKELREVVRHQIPRVGSCGSGNHFLEIQYDESDNIWLMFHFGSRNLGQQTGIVYNKIANDYVIKNNNAFAASAEISYLPTNEDSGKSYINAMNLCLDYAEWNHAVVNEKIKKIVNNIVSTDYIEEYYVRHNYASLENHFGKNVWVHRKGATLARKDTIGIIPGSQGSASYIVKGKGVEDSFMSCSHGAGRTMSRTKAKTELNLEEQIKILDDKGIVHAIRGINDLDEAPGAYKDISVVMAEQADLVDVLVKLTPLAVIKG